MSPRALFDVRRFGSIASTNSYLLEEARQGAHEGMVALADHQTHGRGRLGRRWEAPPGTSLLVSVLLRPVLPPDRLHLCTAIVALATADGCAQVAGVEPVLKWPNDLVFSDKKVAGVLAESDPSAPGGGPGSVAVVVGVGCNVDWPGPPGAGGTSLTHEAGRTVEREALFEALLDGLAERRRALDDHAAWDLIIDELRQRSATLGRPVRVERSGRPPLFGTAVDLSAEGHLVVATGDATVDVAAGDVVLLRPGQGPGGSR